MSVEPEYEWPRPPVGGYTSDDLDRLPNLPPHTELLDGSLVLVSPQAKFHMRAVNVLMKNLVQCAPPEIEVIREMTVTLGRRNRPEPDIMLVRADADTGPRQTTYHAEDVFLAAEVVSPDSVERDHEVKPRKYAGAGIPHFWRVEQDDGRAIVRVFELNPTTRSYRLTGSHHDHLKLSEPFPADIDLTEIHPRAS